MHALRRFGRGAYAAAAAGVPDFALMLLFGVLWVAPRLVGVKRISDALLALALEFVAVFAAGLLAITLAPGRSPFGAGRASFLALCLVGLTAILGYICVMRGILWPLFAFWMQTGNRLAAWWKGPDEYSRRAGILSWVFSPVFYVAAILITTYTPLPPLGVTPKVKIDGGLLSHDLWDTDPQRGLAAGMLYYGLQGLYRRAGRLQAWLLRP